MSSNFCGASATPSPPVFLDVFPPDRRARRLRSALSLACVQGYPRPLVVVDTSCVPVSEPEEARDCVRRIKFVYTPKHGSWLNVAECELSCLTSQCLSDRRIVDIVTLQSEIAAWAARSNVRTEKLGRS